MNINVKICVIPIFHVFNKISSHTLILRISQLDTVIGDVTYHFAHGIFNANL